MDTIYGLSPSIPLYRWETEARGGRDLTESHSDWNRVVFLPCALTSSPSPCTICHTLCLTYQFKLVTRPLRLNFHPWWGRYSCLGCCSPATGSQTSGGQEITARAECPGRGGISDSSQWCHFVLPLSLQMIYYLEDERSGRRKPGLWAA